MVHILTQDLVLCRVAELYNVVNAKTRANAPQHDATHWYACIAIISIPAQLCVMFLALDQSDLSKINT